MESFKDYLIIEATKTEYSYNVNMRNLKELYEYLTNWKSKIYSFDLSSPKVIEVYKGEKFIGEIKDKGKTFIVDKKVSSEKDLKKYIEDRI